MAKPGPQAGPSPGSNANIAIQQVFAASWSKTWSSVQACESGSGSGRSRGRADPRPRGGTTQSGTVRGVREHRVESAAGPAVGTFLINRSQRNPTPLFGLGLIDSIPDEAILAMENRQAKESPATRGRVSRLKDGRIGRLGWKGQTANTEDFVLNACAVELGLEVPGHHQAMTPQAPKYRADGLDLTTEECSALVAYVRSLPRPAERQPSAVAEAKHIDSGRATFAAVGCANCHTPKVGNVQGIYSDLLLHDMGQEMGDEGSYGEDSSDATMSRWSPGSSPTWPATVRPRPRRRLPSGAPPVRNGRPRPCGASATRVPISTTDAPEPGRGRGDAWRPGRGRGASVLRLTPRERLEVEAFLKSLVAPSAVRLARNGD